MYSIYKATDLPRSEPDIQELLWANYLHAARGGCDESATLVLAGLAWHLQQNCLTDKQREFLSDALAAIADANAGADRQRAVKENLLLGRRPGSRPKHIAERVELRRALNMWMQVGDVADADVDAACEAVLQLRSADAPDIRPLRRAYLKHRAYLRAAFARQAPNSE